MYAWDIVNCSKAAAAALLSMHPSLGEDSASLMTFVSEIHPGIACISQTKTSRGMTPPASGNLSFGSLDLSQPEKKTQSPDTSAEPSHASVQQKCGDSLAAVAGELQGLHLGSAKRAGAEGAASKKAAKVENHGSKKKARAKRKLPKEQRLPVDTNILD